MVVAIVFIAIALVSVTLASHGNTAAQAAASPAPTGGMASYPQQTSMFAALRTGNTPSDPVINQAAQSAADAIGHGPDCAASPTGSSPPSI